MTAGTAAWSTAYGWYLVLLVATVGERVVELVVSARNARWAIDRGGHEEGRGHFPAMVALQIAFGIGCAIEPPLAGRPILPALAIPCLILALAVQGLRWWCIGTLGRRWNTRIVVVPGLPLVARGPYRLLRHPNYVAVAVEGVVLPLIASAWVTAIAFTVLNAVLLLRFRIPAEERALRHALAEAAA